MAPEIIVWLGIIVAICNKYAIGNFNCADLTQRLSIGFGTVFAMCNKCAEVFPPYVRCAPAIHQITDVLR